MARALIEAGADVNAMFNDSHTLFQRCAEDDHVKVARGMNNTGVGWTPLHVCAHKGHWMSPMS